MAQLVAVVTTVWVKITTKDGAMVKAEAEGGGPDGRVLMAVEGVFEIAAGGLECEKIPWRAEWVGTGEEYCNIGEDFSGDETEGGVEGHGGLRC